MPIEHLAKAVVEASQKDMSKPQFEDSNRTSGIEKPRGEVVQDREYPELKKYPDSERELPEGPKWNEDNLGDLKSESKPLDKDIIIHMDQQSDVMASEKKEDSKDLKETKEAKDSKDGSENVDDSGEKKGLTDEQKQEIKEKTGWSDEIINAMGSMEEAEIYMKAGLQEVEINGKKCLIRSDIDMDQKDEDGISNRERMERGRPPITKDGDEVELHHIGQKPDSPLAELTTQEHRGTGNDTILHDKNKESEINRGEFAKERKEHWKSRAEEGG